MIMCEYLLTSANEKPLNEDEHNAIECYREELAKLLRRQLHVDEVVFLDGLMPLVRCGSDSRKTSLRDRSDFE